MPIRMATIQNTNSVNVKRSEYVRTLWKGKKAIVILE